MPELTHFNPAGFARMVDVGTKDRTDRTATARAVVYLNAETYALVRDGKAKKGDVLAVAQVAGIMAAKKTSELIPMCHPIALTSADIDFAADDAAHTITVTATTRCNGETGVEMEAMTAVSVAALTIYDMCKAAQRDIKIGEIQLLTKTGGKSGDYILGE
ncbi:MAG: cyclic pyranopterin monophosphate synthase MoaC [Oscillospiraceae bacterium]|jgi:cyclic pyranopterin phosphate synthase|nr:cyclic pyranopterin monophosphate synthase MoaC [Oscillospiraceae bacterium]